MLWIGLVGVELLNFSGGFGGGISCRYGDIEMFKNRICTGFIRNYKSVITAVCVSLVLSGCGQQQQSTDLLGAFTLDVPIAYVKRPIDTINDINPLGDPRNPFHFTPGGDLYYRAVASSDSPEINLTSSITAADPANNKDTAGDVADPSVSYDGTKIIFAMKIGEFKNTMPADQPTWNIWEYDLTTDTLRRVISGDIKAEEGNDGAPAYLPDGRIVFLSDRQTRSKQFLTEYGYSTDSYLDEDRRDPAAVLHVMNPDGSKIQQISFNQSDDLDPSVLSNGKIIFSRWEHAASKNQVDIFQVNPDGTDLNILYGADSHLAAGSNAAFVYPREMPDGRLIANVMPLTDSFDRGDMALIDAQNFVDINTPKIVNTSSQSKGQVSVTGGQVPVTSGLSPYGRYASAFPLWDGTNRLLVSWTPCLAQLDNGDPTIVNTNPVIPCPSDTTGYVPAQPLYHIVIVDLDQHTQKPIVFSEPGVAILQPVALVDRTLSLPQFIPDKSVANGDLDQNMVTDEVGAIDIRSVYDTTSFTGIGMQAARLFNNEKLPCNTPDFSCVDGNTALLSKIANPDYVTTPFNSPTDMTLPRRPARFVRIVTAVPTPPKIPRFAYGTTNTEMRAIAGYAPVEPDGSVYVEVPADVPFAAEVLDDQGRKFASHNDWMQVRPGETLKCNGCHSPSDGSASINAGASMDGTPYFSNINPAVIVADATTNIYVPRKDDTMAEARVRLSCETGTQFCDARKLQSDLEYNDVWSDPAMMTPEASYHIEYKDSDLSDGNDGLSTTLPILNAGPVNTANCTGDPANPGDRGAWISKCRIVINYLEHIQPLWDKDRTADSAGNPFLDAGGQPVNYRCTTCHSDTAADGVTAQVPAGARQLDLAAADPTTAIQNPDDNWATSYQELLRPKFEREIDAMGALIVSQDSVTQDVTDPVTGITTSVTTFTNRPLSTGSPIVAFSARRSYLIEKLTETELGAGRSLTTTVDHSKMMTAAEIRLISEWIDLGVPYYSNPYVIP